MSKLQELSLAAFDTEVTASELPVLVDFWAEWCMPCRMIAPSVEQLAETYKGKLKVFSVNVDNEPDLAGKFNVVSIPTLIVFKGGVLHRQKVGAVPKHDIESLFKDLVK
jgi:thioredoxin 1